MKFLLDFDIKLWIIRKSSNNVSFFFHLVGITWDDAPTEQHAVIKTDYKIRCVVLASPPATIDWLKESLIVSTGRSFWHFFFFHFVKMGLHSIPNLKPQYSVEKKKVKGQKGLFPFGFHKVKPIFLHSSFYYHYTTTIYYYHSYPFVYHFSLSTLFLFFF